MDEYWTTVGHTHHIDLDAIRTLCFQLVFMFTASKALAHRFADEAVANKDEGEPDVLDDSLLRLHDERIRIEASKTLLSLAMALRTYDDYMKNGERSAEYEKYVNEHSGDSFIGGTSDQKRFDYRDASNKVIHARKLNFLKDRLNRDDYGDEEEDAEIWCLTGEVELTGTKGKTAWDAQLYIEEFVETVLDVVAFGYEEPADPKPSS